MLVLEHFGDNRGTAVHCGKDIWISDGINSTLLECLSFEQDGDKLGSPAVWEGQTQPVNRGMRVAFERMCADPATAATPSKA